MSEGTCVFEGLFGEIHIPDLLTMLDMLGKTGTLELRRDDVVKCLHWEDGEIVFADSSLESEQIAGYLCSNGWISPEALADAREACGEDEDSLVGCLVKAGELDPSRLPKALRTLVLEIVYSLFEWQTGTFRFFVTESAHTEKVVLRTSVSNTIMEGTRRQDEWTRFREVFPTNDVVLAPGAEEPPVSVRLAPVEEEILGHVDGRRDIAELIQLVPHDQFTTLGALHTLLTTGFVKKADAAATQDADAAAAGNGLSPPEADAAQAIVTAFNNIFAAIHEKVVVVNGETGQEQFSATLQKGSFQKSGVFSGISFEQDGRVPTKVLLQNVAALPEEERLSSLKGSMDRLLAHQVRQMGKDCPASDKKAISELISKEKASIVTG